MDGCWNNFSIRFVVFQGDAMKILAANYKKISKSEKEKYVEQAKGLKDVYDGKVAEF